MKIKGLTTIRSGRPGPTVAIFGGVHGDERAGIEVVTSLRTELSIARGTVHLVHANPPAMAARQRMLAKNLNRVFVRGNQGTAPEDARARELMRLMDTCDGLLDLHEHHQPGTGPFLICERPVLAVAKAIGAPIISFGWTAAEIGGTEGYMHEQGKVGIGYESGPATRTKENIPRARGAVDRFLSALGLTDEQLEPMATAERFIEVERTVMRHAEEYELARDFRMFEPLRPGELIARQGGVDDFAGSGELIVFPKADPPPGTEAYLVGSEIGPI